MLMRITYLHHTKVFRCSGSVPKTTASEEFTQKGSARKSDIGDIIEIAEKTEQTVCFGIFRIIFAYFTQDRFGKLA